MDVALQLVRPTTVRPTTVRPTIDGPPLSEILEVVKARTDPKRKRPKTIHHHGCGNFVVDSKTMTLKSKMP